MGNRYSQESVSPLPHLPFELLCLVAKFVNENDPPRCPHHGILRRQRGDLISLSLVNKAFRQACIESGLFTNLKPHRIHNSRTAAAAFLQSLAVEHKGHRQLMKVDSLCIDLTAPKTWFFCVRILQYYPDVPELCFRGGSEVPQDADFDLLDKGCQRFRGHSLVLRDLYISTHVYHALNNLRLQKITNIEVHAGNLGANDALHRMSFPNLKTATISLNSKDWKETMYSFHHYFLEASRGVSKLDFLYCWQGTKKWVPWSQTSADLPYGLAWYGMKVYLRSLHMNVLAELQVGDFTRDWMKSCREQVIREAELMGSLKPSFPLRRLRYLGKAKQEYRFHEKRSGLAVRMTFV